MKTRIICSIAIAFLIVPICHQSFAKKTPTDRDAKDAFVDVKEVIPSIVLDIRYFTPHNFVGERINGYNAPKCLLTKEAAAALADVQKDLEPFSLSLKVYDCFRPAGAVAHFIDWAKDLKDERTKREFYPDVQKENLFKDGYIAEKSGHSRGSTVDLTIVPVPTPNQEDYKPGQKLNECTLPAPKRFKDNSIDMGVSFDCFSPLSTPENPGIGLPQRINRLLLKSVMERHGFIISKKEWWHYTLKGEPFPSTYFDFPVE